MEGLSNGEPITKLMKLGNETQKAFSHYLALNPIHSNVGVLYSRKDDFNEKLSVMFYCIPSALRTETVPLQSVQALKYIFYRLGVCNDGITSVEAANPYFTSCKRNLEMGASYSPGDEEGFFQGVNCRSWYRLLLPN